MNRNLSTDQTADGVPRPNVDPTGGWGGPGFGPNPKPNQQGTFFSGRRSKQRAGNVAARTGDEVGHKGYSPNRLNAVREKLPVDTFLSVPAATEAVKARHGGEIIHANVTDEDKNIATRMTAGHIHDVVARSTMPMEHIQGLPDTRIRTLDMSPSAGSFNRQTGGVSLDAPGLASDRQWGADTVIHELGHAVDASRTAHQPYGKPNLVGRPRKDKTWVPPPPVPGVTTNNPNPMSSPEAAAGGEGFADAYALKHSRGRGGAEVDRPKGSTVPYEQYGQRDWENYAGFAPDEELSPQERAPKAYHEAMVTHGGRQPMAKQGILGEGDIADIWNGGAALVRKKR